MAAKISQFLKSYFAEIILVWIAFLFYYKCPFFKTFLSHSTRLALFYISVSYTAIAIPFLISATLKNKTSKGLVFLRILKNFINYSKNYLRELSSNPESKSFQLEKEEQTLILFMLIKFLFIPVMLQFTVLNLSSIFKWNELISTQGLTISLANTSFFRIIVALMFFIDTAFFLFGYLVESSFFKNKVKSVDSSYLGWIVALACYPPFNKIYSVWFPMHEDFSLYFSNETLTIIFRIFILFLLFIYMASSVSLGTKCSNLTNRGIITMGTYRIVRHPAYISKVLIWIILLIPVIPERPFVIICIIAWGILYFLRAITEERHLIQDPDYKEYCKKVKYRFIPFLY